MQNKNYKSIKSFEDACKAEGKDAAKLIAQWTNNGDTKDEIAYKMWKMFLKAINGTWVADHGDASQQKWYIIAWVEKKGKGAGFRVTGTNAGWACTRTRVGSRLCTETEEQIIHAFKYGEQMYLDFFLG